MNNIYYTYISGFTGPFKASVTRYLFFNGVFSSIVTWKMSPYLMKTKKVKLIRNIARKLNENIEYHCESINDKIHLKLFTWTPCTLSTKIWLLFLLIRWSVIESEVVFSVCGNISYGDLLGSTFRHRLFLCNIFQLAQFYHFYNCLFEKRISPAETAIFASFELVSIDSNDAC